MQPNTTAILEFPSSNAVEESHDVLTETLRRSAKQLLAAAVEAEAAECMERLVGPPEAEPAAPTYSGYGKPDTGSLDSGKPLSPLRRAGDDKYSKAG